MEKFEFEFNFNDQDLEKYNAKIETKAQREKDRQKSQDGIEDEETKYVAETDYSSEAFKNLNIEHLNLFGMSVDQQEEVEDVRKASGRQKKFVQELLDVIDKMDENASLSDFTIRKNFLYYNVSYSLVL